MDSISSTQAATLSSYSNVNRQVNIDQPVNELPAKQDGVARQQAVNDSVSLSSESLSLSKQAKLEEVKAVSQDSQLNPYAEKILGAITDHVDQLVKEGASPETVKQAIYDGMNGFQQGYGDALSELESAGLLNDDLKAQLAVTEQQVMQGLNDYAKANGLELEEHIPDSVSVSHAAPVVAEPINSNNQVKSTPVYAINEVKGYQQQSIVESFTRSQQPANSMQARQSAFVESYKEYQSASMEIVTQDGDRVSLNFEALKSMQVSGGYRDSEAGLTQLLQASQSGGSNFGLSIEGELDEGELQALVSLMEDVNALAGEFFDGDFDRAFQMATEIQMDKSELSSMSLDLKRSVSYEAVQSYSNIANNGHANTSSPEFKTNYLANGLQAILEKAGHFANKEDLIKDLFANQWAQQSLDGLNTNATNSVYDKAEPLQAFA